MKAAGKVPGRLPIVVMRDALRFENGDDLVRARVDDEDLVADQDIVVTAPLGIDHKHLHRQRIEVHAVRNTGADRHCNIQTCWFHLVLLDDGGDLGASFGRKIR